MSWEGYGRHAVLHYVVSIFKLMYSYVYDKHLWGSYIYTGCPQKTTDFEI